MSVDSNAGDVMSIMEDDAMGVPLFDCCVRVCVGFVTCCVVSMCNEMDDMVNGDRMTVSMNGI